MRLGGVALDGDCREGGTFTFSAIRLKFAFSKISYCTFKYYILGVLESDTSWSTFLQGFHSNPDQTHLVKVFRITRKLQAGEFDQGWS